MQTTKEYSGFSRIARCRTDCSESFSGTSLPEHWIDGDGPDLPDQWFICIEYATYLMEFSKASGRRGLQFLVTIKSTQHGTEVCPFYGVFTMNGSNSR